MLTVGQAMLTMPATDLSQPHVENPIVIVTFLLRNAEQSYLRHLRPYLRRWLEQEGLRPLQHLL